MGFFLQRHFIESIAENHSDSNIDFYCSNYFETANLLFNYDLFNKKIEKVEVIYFGSEENSQNSKFKIIKAGFEKLFFFIQKTLKSLLTKKPCIKKYKIGWRCYSSDFGFSNVSLRNNSFIIDNKSVNTEDLIYIVETPCINNYYENLDKTNYNYISLEKKNSYLTFFQSLFYLFKYFKYLIISCSKKNNLLYDYLSLLGNHYKWSSLLNEISFDKYVVYNDISENHIPRNVIFSNKKIESVFLTHSAHNDYVFMKDGYCKQPYHYFYSFYYYDMFISWNDVISNFYKVHPNFIKKYYSLGCLWSECVKKYALIKKTCVEHFFNSNSKVKNSKIISFCDTSFGCIVWNLGVNIITEKYLIEFLKAGYKLLEDNSNYFMIVCLKNDLSEIKNLSEKLLSAYNNLTSHPRALNIRKYNEDNPDFKISTDGITALSDLVISIPFTSTTNEALGAGKRAVFFDPTGELKNTYYNNYQNLVANGYDELKKLVDDRLNLSEKDFNKYLETVIKPNIDPYCDGNAIKRLRDLLNN